VQNHTLISGNEHGAAAAWISSPQAAASSVRAHRTQNSGYRNKLAYCSWKESSKTLQQCFKTTKAATTQATVGKSTHVVLTPSHESVMPCAHSLHAQVACINHQTNSTRSASPVLAHNLSVPASKCSTTMTVVGKQTMRT
jgi:hypothetical protein